MIKTSDHELDGVAHCSPSKRPDQDWLHLAGTQGSSEAQWNSLATRATALWKHHACNSPTRQNEQPEHMPPAPQQRSTQKSSVRTTSDFKNPCYVASNSSQNNAMSAMAPNTKANHCSLRVRTTLHQLLHPIQRTISQTQAATGLLWPSHNSRPFRMEEGLQHKESRLHSNIMHTA